jgi:dynein heavy chain
MLLLYVQGFFAAMGRAGGARNELDPRFVSKFCVFNVTSPSDDAVKHIYRSILSGHTEDFVQEIRPAVSAIVDITLDIWKVRRDRFQIRTFIRIFYNDRHL